MEIGDAGQTLATAQVIPGSGETPTNILGSPGPSEADIFGVYLTSGTAFSATTTLSATRNFFDTQLFLFGPAGLGLAANDDDNDSPPQSTLTYLPALSGIYYLAIAGYSFDPVSAGGLIFPAVDFVTVQPGDLRGPTGPGGASPLSGWTGTSNHFGDYDIALTGALAGAPATIPEPSTAVLITTIGVLLAGFKLPRRCKPN